jgi:hypothetical protein
VSSPVHGRRSRRGSKLALAAAIPLLLFGFLTGVTFVGGAVSGDDEVSGNIAGFVILLAATVVPGVVLLRRYLRPDR